MLKLVKNHAKVKQIPDAKLLPSENYLLSPSTLLSQSNRAYSTKCSK